jgi:hypothetical protein
MGSITSISKARHAPTPRALALIYRKRGWVKLIFGLISIYTTLSVLRDKSIPRDFVALSVSVAALTFLSGFSCLATYKGRRKRQWSGLTLLLFSGRTLAYAAFAAIMFHHAFLSTDDPQHLVVFALQGVFTLAYWLFALVGYSKYKAWDAVAGGGSITDTSDASAADGGYGAMPSEEQHTQQQQQQHSKGDYYPAATAAAAAV